MNVADDIDIELRAGDDALSVVKTEANDFNADGGAGRDTLNLLDNLFAVDEDSFEL
ncbi:MAG: hypothetical protein U0936_13050 [Planctomycetaceae bacterium]